MKHKGELPKAVKIARENHYCWKCGRLIKKGDKFTMRMDREARTYKCYPICLKCDGRGYDKKYGKRTKTLD